MYLRDALINDAELLFEWVNEASVRINSLNQELITYENHVKWFQKKLMSPESKILIMMLDNIAIGQVRIDLDETNWVIDYSIDLKYRGKGYGKVIIDLLMKKFSQYNFIANVKKQNIASKKVFLNLGFKEIEEIDNNLHSFQYKA